MRALFSFVLGVALLLVGANAHATPAFPDVVKTELGLPAAPECTLCHVGTPARGTVTTPFGATLRSRGAQGYDDDSLRTALAAITAEKKDSDGDGAFDVDELKNGTSPNSAGGDEIVAEYGCSASPSRTPTCVFLAAVLCAFLVFIVRRRSRRRDPVSSR